MDTIRPSFHELMKPFEPVCVNSQKKWPIFQAACCELEKNRIVVVPVISPPGVVP